MAAAPQRADWLRAMGYQPLALRRSTVVGDVGVEVETPRGLPGETPSVEEPARAGPATTQPNRVSTADAGTALWTALLRACDAEPAEAEALGWKQSCIDQAFAFVGAELHFNLSLLRRQPAAKRALWRTLRALRRQRREAR